MASIVGTKSQVYKGTADKTKYGYTKKDIIRRKQKDGTYRYVWKSKSQQAKKQYQKNAKIRKAFKQQQQELKKKMKKTSSRTTKKKGTLSSLFRFLKIK